MFEAVQDLVCIKMKEVKAIEHLLLVTEELLFSFPLPTDLVHKYIHMRENAFAKASLKCNNDSIWRMQRAALSRRSSSQCAPSPDIPAPCSKSDKVYHTLNQYRSLLITFINSLKDAYNSLKYCDKYIGNTLSRDIIIVDPDNLILTHRKFVDEYQAISTECENLTKSFIQSVGRNNSKLEKYKNTVDKLSSDIERLGNEIRNKQESGKASDKITKREGKVVSFQDDEKSEEVASFKNQVNKLLREKSNLQHELEDLKEEQQRSVESSIASHTKRITYEIRAKFEAENENLAKKFKAREEELKESLEKLAKEYSIMIKELREKIERSERKDESFRSILKSIGERLSDVFNTYIDRDKQMVYWKRKQELESISPDIIWQNYCDILAQIEIILSLLTSTSTLLLSKPNAPSYLEGILYSIQNSSHIMDEFLLARNKLLQVFEEE